MPTNIMIINMIFHFPSRMTPSGFSCMNEPTSSRKKTASIRSMTILAEASVISATRCALAITMNPITNATIAFMFFLVYV